MLHYIIYFFTFIKSLCTYLYKNTFAGHASCWNYGSSLSRIDHFCVSDEDRFYRIAQLFICRCAYFTSFRLDRNDLARQNYNAGLCGAWCATVLCISNLRHANDDWRQAQVFYLSRGIHFCRVESILGCYQYFHLYLNYYWRFARLICQFEYLTLC